MLASVPAGYTPQFVHTPTAKAGSVLVYNGQCWHSGGSHPGAPGIGERHSLFAHYRKSCTAHSSKERRRPLFWRPFLTVAEPAPGLLVPLSGFLASRRREQRKNGEKSVQNGRDTAI